MAINSIIKHTCDLSSPLTVTPLKHHLVSGDNMGDRFEVTVLEDAQPVSLASASVTAYFIRSADNSTVTLTGTASGNVASVTLPKACYAVPGRFSLVIKASIGSALHAIYACEGAVLRSTTDDLVDPGSVVPDIQDLLAQIDRMERATVAAETASANSLTFRGFLFETSPKDANDFYDIGIWAISGYGTNSGLINGPSGLNSGWFIVIPYTANIVEQIYIPYIASEHSIWYTRAARNKVFSSWEPLNKKQFDEVDKKIDEVDKKFDKVLRYVANAPVGGDANNYVNTGMWFISASGGVSNLSNVPANFSGLMIVVAISMIIQQVLIPYNGAKLMKRSRLTSGSWEDWQIIDGGGDAHNVTINKTINEYQNSYTLYATPSIKTDTNNYLAPTGDTSDATGNILAMLVSSGVCNLGPGDYYIKNLKMPERSTIRGCGDRTRIILLPGAEYGLEVSSLTTIKDVSILGNNGSAITIQKEPREQAGIRLQGQATEHPGDKKASNRVIIDGCRISYCGYGLLFRNTGGGTSDSVQVNNCFCFYNDCGIGIIDWSEYHNFTNVKSLLNWYGVINNGGNNKFSNCNFDSNRVGFYMNNTTGESQNTSHGSVVCCSFNHQYGESGVANAGVAVHIENMDNTCMTFSGCQFFYGDFEFIGRTKYANAVFGDSIFGAGLKFNVEGSNVFVLLADSFFGNAPTITDTNRKIKVHDCYLSNGSEITH